MSDDTQSGFDTPKPGDDSLSPDSKPASDIDSRLEHMASRGFTPSQALGGSRPSGAWEPPTPEELQAQMPQYKVLEVIGRGGMGAVYKGWQSSLDRYVAIKILPPDLDGSDANFSARFKQEAKTMARLSHPGIVPVYDAGETNTGLFYFVMEFVEGSDVAQMVKQQGKLQPDHALAITAHVCDALTYAHEHGVIHRDIKPANIMLNHEGQVKVADFGLAKSTEVGANSGLTNTTMTVGTPDFIAPEALIMGVYSDHRADLYAVGVMLYNMLTGEIPRGRWKLPSEKVGSDVRFDAIINKAMEAEREDRYQSAREIRRELDVIQSTPMERTSPPMQQAAPASKPAASPSPPQRAAKVAKAGAPRKKSSTVPIFAVGGSVAAIGLGAFFIFQKPKGPPDSRMATTSAAEQQIPRPDGKPADMSKPVQVFILMGQSNMLGMGKITGGENSLENAVKTKKKYPYLVDDEGNWSERKDVRNVRVMFEKGRMQLFNNEWMNVKGTKGIGPEFGIGHVLGNAIEAPVLILKSCIGNRSLGWDLLPPGSESYEFEGTMVPGYRGTLENPKGNGQKPGSLWYAGKQYDDDTDSAKKVLTELDQYYPGAKGYEVAGFFFWQGEKDCVSAENSARYEKNLVQFIKQLRKDFAAPNAKFVLATLGEATKGSSGNGGKVLNAQLAVDGDSGKHPEFKGNVATVYSNPMTQGGGGGGRYGGNAEVYMDVGEAMGKAMVDLLKK